VRARADRFSPWAAAFAAAVLASGLGVAATPPAPTYSITLYEHKDFEGRSLTYTGAIANLSATGLNDRISSLRLVLGQKWMLCKNKKFHGGCIVVDRDVPDLEALGFNDTMSSLKPVD
jgi:hypothetical protein